MSVSPHSWLKNWLEPLQKQEQKELLWRTLVRLGAPAVLLGDLGRQRALIGGTAVPSEAGT